MAILILTSRSANRRSDDILWENGLRGMGYYPVMLAMEGAHAASSGGVAAHHAMQQRRAASAAAAT